MPIHPWPQCNVKTFNLHVWWRSNKHWCVNENKNLTCRCNREKANCADISDWDSGGTIPSTAVQGWHFKHQLFFLGEQDSLKLAAFILRKQPPPFSPSSLSLPFLSLFRLSFKLGYYKTQKRNEVQNNVKQSS